MPKNYPIIISAAIAGLVLLVIFVSGQNQPPAPNSANPLDGNPNPTQIGVSPDGKSATIPIQPRAQGESVASGISLTISFPEEGKIVNKSRLTVSGKTAPNAEVFINEADAKANSTGNFSASITLEEGDNIVSVMANDENGNFAEKDFVITYTP